MSTATLKPSMLKVKVCHGNIQDGVQFQTCECPIALALRDALPYFTGEIEVSVDCVTFECDQIEYPLPQAAQDWMEKFDALPYWDPQEPGSGPDPRAAMDELEFEMRVPGELV